MIKKISKLMTLVLSLVFLLSSVSTMTVMSFADNPEPPSASAQARVLLGEQLGFEIATSEIYTENKTATFIINGREITVSPKSLNGRCSYVFTGISPQEIGDVIEIDRISAECSLAEYLRSLIETEGLSEEVYAAASALLRYGIASRVFQTGKGDTAHSAISVEDLDNYEPAVIAVPFRSDVAENEQFLSESTRDISISGFTYYFDSLNRFCLIIDAESNEGVEVVINGTSYKDNAIEEFEEDFIVYSTPIKIKDLTKPISGELKVDGETAQTFSYSVKAYAAALNESGTEEAANLALSLYDLGVKTTRYQETVSQQDQSLPGLVDVPSDLPEQIQDISLYSWDEIKEIGAAVARGDINEATLNADYNINFGDANMKT